MPMITYARAVGLRRFWTWASNRRQRVSFIEAMAITESPRFIASNATKLSNCKKCYSYFDVEPAVRPFLAVTASP
jgi:hypothetical protein